MTPCLLCIILLISAGCTTSPRFASLAPAWSSGLVVAHARSSEPPAIGPRPNGSLLIAWADGADVYSRVTGADGRLEAPVGIATGISPWDTALIPGTNGEWHLLWRDFDAYAVPRLFSAHLDREGRLLRGPLAISPDGVGLYRAMPADGGTAVVIWASPDPQPNLYGKAIDAQGRPSAAPPALIARHAEYPALTRTASGLWIAAWLAWPDSSTADSTSRAITLAASQSALPWEGQSVTVLDQLVFPNLTTYVETFALGLDHEAGYVFTSLRDAATQAAHTSLRTFSLATLQAQGRAIGVEFPGAATGADAGITTGFNTGEALALPADPESALSASHPAPAPGQRATLPVAFAAGDSVIIGYFSAGRLAGYQPVIQAARPLGPLEIAVDRALNLALGWASQPEDQGAAAPLVISATGLAISENPDTAIR